MNIAVIGLGKLGLPMAALFASKGHRVIGIDRDPWVVEEAMAGRDPHNETGLGDLLMSLPEGMFEATDDMSMAGEAEVIFIVVPTPSDGDGRFSNDYVIAAINELGLHLSPLWQTIVVSSTVMPGSMDEVIIPALEAATGRKVGTEIGAAYSPQFIALGSVLHDMANPDFILIGAAESRSAGDVADALEPVVGAARAGAATTFINAEIAKLSLNAYITMKIAFANSIAEICECYDGADAVAVTDIIGMDSRIGSKYLRPGGPPAGTCFPRDARAFGTLDSNGYPHLARATQEVNREQVLSLAQLLEGYGSVAILGMAYKPGTPVIMESLGLNVGEKLSKLGAEISWHDPMATAAPVGQQMQAQQAVGRSEAVLVALVDPLYASLDYGERFVIDVWRQLPPGRPNTFVVGRGAQ